MASKTIISQKLKQIIEDNKSQTYTLEKLITQLDENAYFLIVLILSVPFLQPIPTIGLSTVFGFFMALLGVGVMFGIKIPQPQFIKEFKLPINLMQIILNTLVFILTKFEYLIRPRLPHFTEHYVVRFLSGFIIIIAGFVLALPLLPGMNFLPALVTFIIALGLLEKDFAIIFLGMILFVIQVIAAITFSEWLYKTIHNYF